MRLGSLYLRRTRRGGSDAGRRVRTRDSIHREPYEQAAPDPHVHRDVAHGRPGDAILTPIHAILTLIHAILTLIHAILTLVHAILTLIHALLTLIHAILKPIHAILTLIHALFAGFVRRHFPDRQ